MLGSANKFKTARNIALNGAVSGNANFDGSGNITITTTQANIAVVTGTFAESTNDYEATVNFPIGFTATNCIVISAMAHNPNNSENAWGTGTVFSSRDYVGGAVPLSVRINNTNILVKMRNINFNTGSEQTAYVGKGAPFNFKVVLMKI